MDASARLATTRLEFRLGRGGILACRTVRRGLWGGLGGGLHAAFGLTLGTTTIGLAALKSEVSHAEFLRLESGTMRKAAKQVHSGMKIKYLHAASRGSRQCGCGPSPLRAGSSGQTASFKRSFPRPRVKHVECMAGPFMAVNHGE